MTKLTLEIPSVGEKNTVAEPKVDTALKKVEEFLNGKNIESTDNLKKEGIAEESLAKVIQEKLTTRLGFVVKNENASFTAETEKWYIQEKEGATCTLPAATKNRIVGLSAFKECKMKVAGGVIYGDYITGLTEVTLAVYQHLLVVADGTNWYVIAGESKREQKYENKTYTKAEMEAGITFSSTRPVFALNEYTGSVHPLSVGGVTVTYSTAIKVPPGQVVKSVAPVIEVATLTFSVLVE